MNTIYDSIILSLEETIQAIEEAKKKKYFKKKNEQYWLDEEKKGVEKYEEEKRLKREKSKQLRSLRVSPKETH